MPSLTGRCGCGPGSEYRGHSDQFGIADSRTARSRVVPGRYTATWDGRDVTGRSVANGVYFYRLDVPGYRDVKKAVVMR